MIKTLIVDDEKIVRKGLISFMPWNDFGMTVVGEANNGETALQFLETNKVDLMLTDLSMPVMSGIELLREVKKKYPHIQFVVLTLHQDFEYIQEALRLGAIDYIAKTQLEKERFEDVLERISSMFKQKQGRHQQTTQQDKLVGVTELVALFSLAPQNAFDGQEPWIFHDAIEVDPGIWFWTDLDKRDKQNLQEWANLNFSMITITGLEKADRKFILQLLRTYQKNHLFYHHNPMQPNRTIDWREIDKQTTNDPQDDVNAIKDKWLSGDWIRQDAVFESYIAELNDLQLPPIRLTRLFYSITDEWNRLYKAFLPQPITMEDFPSSWYQFVRWLRDTKKVLATMGGKSSFAPEIHQSILQAMTIAQQEITVPLTAGEMARKVNMSSSYFSQCFKEIVGKTYTDYIRMIRLERAKHYLRHTTKTIHWIAEQVGYHDEKYFSRLFREYVGKLPSEYRQDLSR